MRVLLIEDDHDTAKIIELALAAEGIVCDITDLGDDGKDASKYNEYDLVILDLMLPDMSGYDVLKSIRDYNLNVPVLILSGLGDSEEKVKGLVCGADDYLTKPFDKRELIARLKAIIRRSKGHAKSVIKIDNLVINLNTHTTTIDNKPVHLTSKEQSVLELMALKKGAVISKENFLSHLYNGMDEPELKIIDVFVCKMRKKLYDISGGINYIETIWGRGYALKDPDEIPESQRIIGDGRLFNAV
ncbi:Two component transcriptional regulator, winged helix family / cell cycle transcriptional regulator CtrA [endosymbiont of Acanthamoeba sp. UWC8]|uniref:response regulator transcription factor n=1 Tax=endosymbiont of Acanthamoeba sp. UWC8 TaxID=86106 RepID=UPI0004D1FD61|nr:response regulator transcription factor [endosymbiont of Acanthamoeba sp. UWC8]AIF80876.1 Two component transcriptional regulator, winged helix family / cell cycle transcriptional regulator CtrA [endosymbiont of Acanthamoeba sp. UWC8]